MLFNKKNALSTVDFKGFSGIDTSSPGSSGIGIRNMVNFKILPDGSLTKRAGFRPLYSVGEGLRAIWTGYVGAKYTCFALVGSSVYRFYVDEELDVLNYKKL